MTDLQTAAVADTVLPADLVLRAHRTWVDGAFRPAAVVVRDGRVASVEPIDADVLADRDETVPDAHVLLPGLVDTHVHVNEPGRTEWEGFASATRAAALGGVTTIIDMPLNSIPATVDVPALQVKRASATGRVAVDVGFWGGAVPDNAGALADLHAAGVFGFKCFTAPSGVDEFPHLDPTQLRAAIAEVAALDALLIVHAEDPDHLVDHDALGVRYQDFLDTRPVQAERSAIARVIDGARETGARVHVLHLSDAGALPMIRAAKDDGVRLTVETCPHYLAFESGSIPDGATAYKCCPPIREASNRELLWKGLEEGTIDCIVSDHSPSTLDLKDLENGDFAVAWGGVSSLQLGLSLIWTEARHRGIPLEKVISWMSTRPAEIARVPNKGLIAVGYDADFSIFAADDAFVVDVQRLKHKNPITPYDGRALSGVVRKTFLRGQVADGTQPIGKLIRRGGI